MVDQPPSGQPEPGASPDPRQTGPDHQQAGPDPQQATPGQPPYLVPGQPPYPAAGQPPYPAANQPPYLVPGQPYPVPAADPSAPGQPPYGSYVPGHGYWQPWPGSWPGQGFADPNDPLVTPPGGGVDGWLARATGIARRSWRNLLLIMLVTQALPMVVLSLALIPGSDPTTFSSTTNPEDPAPPVDQLMGDLLPIFGIVFLAVLLGSLLQSVGWAAGTWALTREALGESVKLADALRYGLRRALGLWLWTLLAGVIIVAGVCACVLPGIYLAFAMSLAGPVFLFERANPIGRSFRIFHNRLGMVLGRVALVVAVIVGVSFGISVLENLGMLAVGGGAGLSVGVVVITVLSALLQLPLYVAQLIGLVVTYAEQRAWEAPVNSAQLAGELG